jgi:hypothetical protein
VKKEIAIIVAVMLLVIVGYTVITMPQEKKAVAQEKPFRFQISPQEYGLLDNGDNVRGYFTAQVIADSVNDSSLQMLLLGNETKSGIYEVIDYQYGKDKSKILETTEASIAPYGLKADGLYHDDAMLKKNAIIIIPSDAMPDVFSSGNLTDLIEGNAVIYFGKPMDISMDISGSQEDVANQLYDKLGVTYKNGVISAKPNGPQVKNVDDATVLTYPGGWFVVYEGQPGNEEQLGRDIAQLILKEGWQSDRVENSFALTEGTGAMTFFSSAAEPGAYHMRILFNATNRTAAKTGMLDIGEVGEGSNRLILDETRKTDGSIGYTFELHSNVTDPVVYDFRLLFIKNGATIDTEPTKTVTMKTFSRESGVVRPNLTSGEYAVKLVDQEGVVHALGYTRVPKVTVRLESITDNTHTFLVTIDDKPADSVPLTLEIDSIENISLKTNKEGRAGADFMLAAGMHTFTAYVKGESGSTRYIKKDDSSNAMVYGGLLLGGAFMLAVMAFGARKKRKWAISTYHRPFTPSKVLDIPYSTFLQLFRMAQEDRAKGLPLTISDLRIGLRKHATFNGAPLFVTDSNIYTLLDGMVKKGKFLSYYGYFLPAEMSQGKPVEYWVLKRRLNDYFVENGEEPESVKDADFMVSGRIIHIYHDPDAKKLVSLCKKNDNIIIFPNEKGKESFMALMQRYDPSWMKLSLELQYGKLYCQTIDEFLERGLHAK